MLIRLKRIDRKEDISIMFNFPYEENEISNVYNQLELETSTAPNCLDLSQYFGQKFRFFSGSLPPLTIQT